MKRKTETQIAIEAILKAAGYNRRQATVVERHGWSHTINVWDPKLKQPIQALTKHLHTFDVDHSDYRTGHSVRVELPYKVKEEVAKTLDKETQLIVDTFNGGEDPIEIQGTTFRKEWLGHKKNQPFMVAYRNGERIGTIDLPSYNNNNMQYLPIRVVDFLF